MKYLILGIGNKGEKYENTRHNIGFKTVERVAEKIADLMKNHSWYVQQFFYYIWSKTEKEVTEKVFKNALSRLIQSNIPFFSKL